MKLSIIVLFYVFITFTSNGYSQSIDLSVEENKNDNGVDNSIIEESKDENLSNYDKISIDINVDSLESLKDEIENGIEIETTPSAITSPTTGTTTELSTNMNELISFQLPPMFVVNLDRAADRWAEVSKVMQEAGLDVERLSAVDGKKLTQEELLKESTRMAMFLQPKGVIGCYLSHKKFWQKVVDEGYESAVIFEDDVRLVSDFKERLIHNLQMLKSDENVDRDYDVILLGAIGRVHPDGKDGIGVRIFSTYIGGNRPLQRLSETLIQPRRPAGTHAYIVSQKGARKLLELCKKATFHVDLDAWRHKVRNFSYTFLVLSPLFLPLFPFPTLLLSYFCSSLYLL